MEAPRLGVDHARLRENHDADRVPDGEFPWEVLAHRVGANRAPPRDQGTRFDG